MAHITIDRKTIENVENDNLILLLNNLIDEELGREVDEIDTAFVDECVDALLELEREENNFVALVPLMSSEKFLRRLTGSNHSSFRSLNVFARAALAAAIIAGGAFTANAAIYAVTGVNVFDEISERIFVSSTEPTGSENHDVGFDDDIEETTTLPAVTEIATEPTTVRTEQTTKHEPTTKQEVTGSESFDAGFEEDEVTTIKHRPVPVTSAKPVYDDFVKEEEAVTLKSITADISNFKTDYIYGEEFSYNGLQITAHYSDGSSRSIPLKDCYLSKIYNLDETADYTLTVLYDTCRLSIPITVRPDEETRGSEICANDKFEYLLTSRGAYLTKYTGSDSEVVLNLIDGNKIVAVSAGAFDGSNVKLIKSIYVKKLFDNAFKGVSTLQACELPNLEYMGSSAFYGCTSLSRLVISDTLDYIGEGALSQTRLTEFTMPQGLTQVPDYLFNKCEHLEDITLSSNITHIGDSAFAECKALERVNGTAQIKSVGDYAFYDDELMDFDAFPQGLERVGEAAFYLCQSLDIGSLPSSVISVGKSSFAFCSRLTEITIPSTMTVIPSDAFRGTGAKSVTIPEGVVEIEAYAFRAIKASEITLPDSLERLGCEAIYSPLLRKIYFGKNISYIADDALYESKSVKLYVYDDTPALQYAVDKSFKYELITQEGQ